MSTYKRKTRKGTVVWAYQFDAPGSTPENRQRITASGFPTKKAATEEEARHRVRAEQEYSQALLDQAKTPRTVAQLLREFFTDCEGRGIAAKTLDRYRQQVVYVSPDILGTQIGEIKPLQLHHEWRRMAEAGGRGRRAGRPLSPKTVKNIAGMVSAAFSRAIFWGLVDSNPVANSEPPKLEQRQAVALTMQQQKLLAESAAHPALPILLELAAATGARRGELLALRWADIQGSRATIARSLSQVGQELAFKATKTERPRVVTLPASAVGILAEHRKRQNEARRQFGAAYNLKEDLIVCQPNGDPLKPDSISAAVSALCKRLKLPRGASLHALRHTHASQLLAGGVEITAVAARLGHASPGTTMKVYAHAISGRDEHAAAVLDVLRAANALPADRKVGN